MAQRAFEILDGARAMLDHTISCIAAGLNYRASVLRLPNELVSYIALFLELPSDRLAMASACRQWRNTLFQDSRLWIPLIWICGGYTSALEYDNLTAFESAVQRTSGNARPLKVVLSVHGGDYNLNNYLNALPRDRLEQLSLHFYMWRDITRIQLSNVTHLTLASESGLSDVVTDCIRHLNQDFPRLFHLTIDSSGFALEEFFELHAAACPSLQYLTLKCTHIDQSLWNIIFKLFPNLVSLNLEADVLANIDASAPKSNNLDDIHVAALETVHPLDLSAFESISRVGLSFTEDMSPHPFRLLKQIAQPTELTLRTVPPVSFAGQYTSLDTTKLTLAEGDRLCRELVLYDQLGTGSCTWHVNGLKWHLFSGTITTVDLDDHLALEFLTEIALESLDGKLTVWLNVAEPEMVPAQREREAHQQPIELPALKTITFRLVQTETDAQEREDFTATPFVSLLQHMYKTCDVLLRPRVVLVWPVRLCDGAGTAIAKYASSVEEVY